MMFAKVKAKPTITLYQHFGTPEETTELPKDSGTHPSEVEEMHAYYVTEDDAIISKQWADVCRGSFQGLATGAYLAFEEPGNDDVFRLSDGSDLSFPERRSLQGITSPAVLVFRPSIQKGVVMLLQNGGDVECLLECKTDEDGCAVAGVVCARMGESPLCSRSEANFRAYIVDAKSIEDVQACYEAKKNEVVLLSEETFDVFDSGSRIPIGLLED